MASYSEPGAKLKRVCLSLAKTDKQTKRETSMKTVIKVHINDRDFNMACDEGEENRLRELAKDVDDRIKDIKSKVGSQINEGMLFVMVAIMFADELRDAKSGQPVAASAPSEDGAEIIGFSQDEVDAQVAAKLEQVAAKIEKLAA